MTPKPCHDPMVKECPDCVDWVFEWAQTAEAIVERQRGEIGRLRKALADLIEAVSDETDNTVSPPRLRDVLDARAALEATAKKEE